METQQEYDYKRVASAINFIKENYKSQPKLEDVADHVNLSPFHFQRMFQNWAGVTPKQFLQYLTAEYAKDILKTTRMSLFDAAHESGLSGAGRLHDLFIKVEGMSPGEYKNGGEALKINYSFADCPFGEMLVAATSKGICHMSFVDNGSEQALEGLKANFPNAKYIQMVDMFQQNALFVFTQDWSKLDKVKLHLKGTDFQIKVWEALLKVPTGGFTTYGDLAANAGHQGASRAVGTAIGSNPVAFLIPCHRVIKSTGEIGQYHWGATRKNAIIGWEAARKAKVEE
ncbi:AraC family transcriptional regulator of adaptative response/methylated-DNA-[protein]-cysteine methyltransferase [Flavobacterium araucananum]|uniref:methylated-DNA--[protein]-cysteine S-methyltransferase n=1 Tax=Flavobacterium araucananum TaxID=946678 RepID=A0A227NBY6_9FLAO|nr:methylated-DNA--[protein]-cysteine S-methyltransferase [Flavobacterium araucananum]OXE95065.1 cysteine methyltransferase [Flavobacterium araucananum]PWJ97077.1 AraC family transcriptional regulator of adaptative response/methylated-DNA-[protein]-cysteine methyltransferase [Flavobacterium araucananum]